MDIFTLSIITGFAVIGLICAFLRLSDLQAQLDASRDRGATNGAERSEAIRKLELRLTTLEHRHGCLVNANGLHWVERCYASGSLRSADYEEKQS